MKLSVRETLKDKHPAFHKFSKSAVLVLKQGLSYTAFHPIIFVSLNSDCLRQCALNTCREPGPSGADALLWEPLCTAFGENSVSLCEALAMTSPQLATAITYPRGLQALTSSRLSVLDIIQVSDKLASEKMHAE